PLKFQFLQRQNTFTYEYVRATAAFGFALLMGASGATPVAAQITTVPGAPDGGCYRISTITPGNLPLAPGFENLNTAHSSGAFTEFSRIADLRNGQISSAPGGSPNPTYINASNGTLAYITEGTPPSAGRLNARYLFNLTTRQRRDWPAGFSGFLSQTFANGPLFGGNQVTPCGQRDCYQPVVYRLVSAAPTGVTQVNLRLPNRQLYSAGIDPTVQRVFFAAEIPGNNTTVALRRPGGKVSYFSNDLSNPSALWAGWDYKVALPPGKRLESSVFMPLGPDLAVYLNKWCNADSSNPVGCETVLDLYGSNNPRAPMLFKGTYRLEQLGLPSGAEVLDSTGFPRNGVGSAYFGLGVNLGYQTAGYMPYTLLARDVVQNRSFIV
ncbi:MAG: hypothetical protein EBZ48_17265, partial [Proteobacteria bacterium]|nr:hypothetical protein [Pseudomonadota bacterium]